MTSLSFKMPRELPPSFNLSTEVAQALASGLPVVALESTVLTHGLPYPDNLKLAGEMESQLRQAGVTPATIAVIEGTVYVGLVEAQILQLVQLEAPRKISVRDFGPAIAAGASGGTTVAGTMLAAHKAGIHIFATGGIGGVHHADHGSPGGAYDISTDLFALANLPVAVVCAGAKAILDIPATLENLETLGVPVVGYQSDEFPAFYSRRSGYRASACANTPEEVAAMLKAHWLLNTSGVLVAAPPPEEVALPYEQVSQAVERALQDAHDQGIRGQQVTPFMLERMRQLTGDASMQANIGLLLNNARLAAQIALAYPHA